MKHLTRTHIEQAASTLEGQHLETIVRGKGFRIAIESDGLYYTLDSNGNRRRQAWKDVDGVLERFNETNSFRTSDYRDISRCASYLLPIIRTASA
jgi:hypothetical protein